MRKIFYILALFFSFATIVSAQEKTKMTEQELISFKIQTEKDVNELAQVMKLSEEEKGDYITIIMMRQEALSQIKSVEDKKAIFEKFNNKMIGNFKPNQIDALKTSNPALYSRLLEFKK